MNLKTVVMAPCIVEFSISKNNLPKIESVIAPTSESVREQILICTNEESGDYPYYRLIGTLGEYTILQKRD